MKIDGVEEVLAYGKGAWVSPDRARLNPQIVNLRVFADSTSSCGCIQR